jgi:hypothetical protein
MKLKIEILEGIPTKHSELNCPQPESNCSTYTFYRAGRVRKTFVKEYKTQSFPRALSFARRLIQKNRMPFDASKVSCID